jgi:hypothetical protein
MARQTLHLRQPAMPTMNEWVVACSRGVVVRQALSLTSTELGILQVGAVVLMKDMFCNQLQYNLVGGSGPASGWVAVAANGKVLLECKPEASITHFSRLAASIGFRLTFSIPAWCATPCPSSTNRTMLRYHKDLQWSVCASTPVVQQRRLSHR